MSRGAHVAGQTVLLHGEKTYKMESLRHRSVKPLSQHETLKAPATTIPNQPGHQLRAYAPLVEAAWCLTAARSRLNSLSTIHEGLASALLKRRWAVARACCEARCEKRAMLRENMVGAGVGTLGGGGERFGA